MIFNITNLFLKLRNIYFTTTILQVLLVYTIFILKEIKILFEKRTIKLFVFILISFIFTFQTSEPYHLAIIKFDRC